MVVIPLDSISTSLTQFFQQKLHHNNHNHAKTVDSSRMLNIESSELRRLLESKLPQEIVRLLTCKRGMS